MSRVEELLVRTREDVLLRKESRPLNSAGPEFPADDRRIRWSKRKFHVIAEAKRSSLSAGVIRENLKLESLIRQYETAGVSALSILTEPHFFHGSLADLLEARTVTRLPLLQKDFIVDEYQILEAKVAGADFILLIVRFLTTRKLEEMMLLCERIGMNALVEVTDCEDLERLPFTPAFLGVNARNLKTLEMDTGNFERLRKNLPETFLIAESGIQDDETLRSVMAIGYNGALIGEHFLRAQDPGKEAARFVSITQRLPFEHTVQPRVKLCGITSQRDALDAIAAGADALGFVFAESPRRIDPHVLLGLRHKIPQHVLAVGVFKDQPEAEIARDCARFSLDVAQIYSTPGNPALKGIETWEARMVHTFDDLTNAGGSPALWDLKLDGNSQQEAWKRLSNQRVFALAGNLNPENVRKAVEVCSPQWVDVASGVESAPGVKDKSRMRAFVNAVRQT